MPLISIITINYNNIEGLKRTVESVLNQTDKDFEYIVIDGDSSDGSREYLEENKESFDYWTSEPDSGIYNAMNKGIMKATGEYLLFLNSGDWLFEKNTIFQVKRNIFSDYDIYYGNAVFKFHDKDLVVKYSQKISFHFFANYNFCHQATFIRRKLFYDIFFYNENFKIVSDWEFFIYAICVKNVTYKYIDVIVCNYDFKGISSLPESDCIKTEERQKVFEKYFPMYIDDYNEFDKLKNVIKSLKKSRLIKLFKRFGYLNVLDFTKY